MDERTEIFTHPVGSFPFAVVNVKWI